jgi:hypothetical protein
LQVRSTRSFSRLCPARAPFGCLQLAGERKGTAVEETSLDDLFATASSEDKGAEAPAGGDEPRRCEERENSPQELFRETSTPSAASRRCLVHGLPYPPIRHPFSRNSVTHRSASGSSCASGRTDTAKSVRAIDSARTGRQDIVRRARVFDGEDLDVPGGLAHRQRRVGTNGKTI